MTVVMLVLLPTLVGASVTASADRLAACADAAQGRSCSSRFAVVVGARAIPRLLDLVAATRSRELFTLTVLVLALGIAVASTTIFGVSMALGAFIAGMTVGRSDYSLRAATDALPMRDAFAVLFFVSIGMLLDPVALLAIAVADAGGARGGRRRQAARRRGGAGPDALSAPHGADRAVGARTDRRVLVHPGRAGARPSACCPDDGARHRRCRVDRVDSHQSDRIEGDHAGRTVARAHAA